MPFRSWCFHFLMVLTVRPHWVASCWQIPLAESSESCDLHHDVHIIWSVCWKWIAHHASWEMSTQKNRRWLDRFSSVKFFEPSNLCLYFGLITCEKCTSAVTANPRSVWCAQCNNVVWTHNDLLPSVAVALRMATCMHQQNPRVRNRKQRPDCWGPKRQMLKTSAKILNWKIIAVTKKQGAGRQVRLVRCGCFQP